MTATKKTVCTLQMVILYLRIIIPNTCNEHSPSEITGRTQKREGVKQRQHLWRQLQMKTCGKTTEQE